MALPALKSPPTNAFGLYQYLAQRVPGYDPSEYLRELNSAYIHVWEEISKLKNHYFENIVQVQVATAQFAFDLMFNGDGGLSAPVSARLYQITKVRVQPPGGGLFEQTKMLAPQDPDFIELSANKSANPTQTGPYYCYPSGRGTLNFALPLAVGTVIEVTYTFWPIAMAFLYGGTVSSSGTGVTGTSTNFTQIVQPDFQAALPTSGGQEEIQAEIVCNTDRIYRVTKITDDTDLTTFTPINPALSGASYVLATLPEIPREHARVIAAIAMVKVYGWVGDDSRISEAQAIAESNIQMMKDSLIERQGQDPPKKIRFPYGVSRRNRAFLR